MQTEHKTALSSLRVVATPVGSFAVQITLNGPDQPFPIHKDLGTYATPSEAATVLRACRLAFLEGMQLAIDCAREDLDNMTRGIQQDPQSACLEES